MHEGYCQVPDNRLYVPVDEAQVLIECGGWVLLDDCPAGADGKSFNCVLLAPPMQSSGSSTA